MADEVLRRDQNFITVLGGITDDSDEDIRMLRVDPITKRLLVKATGGGGGGVTSLNTLTGDITLAAGSNITLTPSGNTITIASTGGTTTAIGGTVTGGTAGSVLFINPTATLAQDNTHFYYDSTNKDLILTATVSQTTNLQEWRLSTGTPYVKIGPPNLSVDSTTNSFFAITATMPSTASGDQQWVGNYQHITTQGITSTAQVGEYVDLLAGYTGSSPTLAIFGVNRVSSTGTNLRLNASTGTPGGNTGAMGASLGTTTGWNFGVVGGAKEGSENFGVFGKAVDAKASTLNVGVMGIALNTGASPTHVGGYFGLQVTTPTFASAALMADNGVTTSDIFVARDNGTAIFTIADGGSITVGGGNISGVGTITANTLSDGAGTTITGGTVTATTITDGTLSINVGNITSAVSVTATTLSDGGGSSMNGGIVTGSTLTDGTASMTAGTISDGAGATMAGGTVTATTLTDGTTIMNAGNIYNAISITSSAVSATTLSDGGGATITGGDISGVGTITATTLSDGAGSTISGGSVTANTLTDGTAIITGGSISGVGTITASTLSDGAGTTITGGSVTASFASATTLSDGAGSTITGGTVTGTTITDGTANMSGGIFTGNGSGLTNIDLSTQDNSTSQFITNAGVTISIAESNESITPTADTTYTFDVASNTIISITTQAGIVTNISIT